jgi:maltooligosyltrehalose trehalohydrolase
VPRQRFIVCAQNHDQVGNRAEGDRLAAIVPAERLRMSAALVLLSPYVPLLFMGEEYGETAPFLYFIEHGDPALVEAVREGRKKEFEHIRTAAAQVDPQARETFERSRLQWSRRDEGEGAQLLALYRDLLTLRREEPALRPGASAISVQGAHDWCTVLRTMPLQGDIYDAVRGQRSVWCAFNLSGHAQDLPVPVEATGAWRLRLSTDARGYGGSSGQHPARIIPSTEGQRDVSDGPKRLMASTVIPEERVRTVRIPAWTAAVYLRELSDAVDA